LSQNHSEGRKMQTLKVELLVVEKQGVVSVKSPRFNKQISGNKIKMHYGYTRPSAK